jgi:hypothetical protein
MKLCCLQINGIGELHVEHSKPSSVSQRLHVEARHVS